MKYRRKPVHLVLDSLPAHKKAIVREYVASTQGRLTLHFLPGYAPDLNPDELVWSHVKRTGTARRPLQKGEKLREKIEEQLAKLQQMPQPCPLIFPRPFCRLYWRLLSKHDCVEPVRGRCARTGTVSDLDRRPCEPRRYCPDAC